MNIPKISPYFFTGLALSAFSLAPCVFAQGTSGVEELLEIGGPASYGLFGVSVSNAGDVDGDGTPDVLTGANFAEVGGVSSGSAYVYSGATGAMIYQFDGTAGSNFGAGVSGGGDVNNDGIADFIISAPAESVGGFSDSGACYVFSGATGLLLYQFNGQSDSAQSGFSVAMAGDTNDDGHEDLVIGAPGHSGTSLTFSGEAYLYSGKDGSLLRTFSGDQDDELLGYSVAAAGDVDGDGYDDVIVGAPNWDSSDTPDHGAAFVYSGFDGSVLISVFGPGSQANCGLVVCGVGDMNEDGIDDVGVRVNNPSDSFRGVVEVHSMHGLVHHLEAPLISEGFGLGIAGAGDINLDGRADLFVSAPVQGGTETGSLYVYLGGSESLMHRIAGERNGILFGQSVANAGDYNGDGVPEVMVGAPFETAGAFYNGAVHVYSFHPYMVANTNTISSSGGGLFGLQLDFPDAAGDQMYKVLFSASSPGTFRYGVDIALGMDKYVLRSYQGDLPFSNDFDFQGTLNAFGDATAAIAFYPGTNANVIGHTFYFAAIAIQPGYLPNYSSAPVPLTILL
jgi:hypothetical protein